MPNQNNPVVPNSNNSEEITGYGRQRLHFSGEGKDFARFLTRLKSYLASRKLNKVLEEGHDDAENAEKKELVYHALIAYLDDESLDLVSTKAENNGPLAIKLLTERFLGKNEDMEVQLLKQLHRMKILSGEHPLQVFTRIDQIKSKLETLNVAYKSISDKSYRVAALDALSDPKYDSFKQAINVRENGLHGHSFKHS